MLELKVGDKVCLEPRDNMGINAKGPAAGVVTKIGRKYVHIIPSNCRFPYRFDRETGKCVGEGGMSPQWVLHLSRQAYDDAMEARKIADEIRRMFEWGKAAAEEIPLANLREILRLAKGGCCG